MDNAHFWFQDTSGGGGGDAGDPIGQSLRFRRGVTYFAPKTFGQTTNINSTHSLWIKFGMTFNPSNYCSIFGDFNSWLNFGPQGINKFNSNGAVVVHPGVWNDRSAWHHIVFQTNNNNFWINGVLIASQTGYATTSNKYTLGSEVGTAVNNLDGYMAEVHHVDGKLLPPTTFGRFNANGVWVPVDPKKDGDTAWYGTNGFHLTFADPGDVGKDYSGNGNDFTATGFETTDQTSPTYDLMEDSPTNNFATLNPLWANDFPGSTPIVTSDANLSETSSTSAPTPSTIAIDVPSYCEFTIGSTPYYVGLWDINVADDSTYLGASGYADRAMGIYTDGSIYVNGGVVGTGLAFNANDVVGLAYDPTSREVFQWVNGVAAKGGNAIHTLPAHVEKWTFVCNGFTGTKQSINYGQQPFTYTPPAGFEPLSTVNMPTDELPDTITGTFLGNSNADGPFVYTGCIPARIQYGTIDVKYQDRLGQANVDFLSNGFKVRSTTSNSGTVNYTVTTTHDGGEYDGNKVPFNSPAPAVSN